MKVGINVANHAPSGINPSLPDLSQLSQLALYWPALADWHWHFGGKDAKFDAKWQSSVSSPL